MSQIATGRFRLKARFGTSVIQRCGPATAGRALLLFTHSPAGIEGFDEIVVLDRGLVVERCTHPHLLAASGLHRRLWDLEQDPTARGAPDLSDRPRPTAACASGFAARQKSENVGPLLRFR